MGAKPSLLIAASTATPLPRSARLPLTAGIVLFCALTVGCPRNPVPQHAAKRVGGDSVSLAGKGTDQGESLVTAAVSQLANMTAYVDLELRPPSVVLDATTSRDNQDVLAVLEKHEAMQIEGAPPIFNRIRVVTQNSRFRGLDVQPGDKLKYYVTYDTSSQVSEEQMFRTRPGASDSDDSQPIDSFSASMMKEAAIELTVAQVLDDNTLIIEGGLIIPIDQPRKIEVWRYLDDRMFEVQRRLGIYAKYGRPRVGWEPAPDERAMYQVVERLNQWLRQLRTKGKYEQPELLSTLPQKLLEEEKMAPYVRADGLGKMSLDPATGHDLQVAWWSKQIASWARGDSFDEVERVRLMFDWVTRNIELDSRDNASPLTTWQSLAFGHGSASHRAAIFVGLCRQERLPAFVLQFASAGEATLAGGEPPMVVGVIIEDACYLFDATLGLPYVLPDGESLATLSDVRGDDAILRQFDLDEAPYPLSQSDFQMIGGALPVSPFELSRAARLLQPYFRGEFSCQLTVDSVQLADKIRPILAGGQVSLWADPWEALFAQLTLGRGARIAAATEFEPFAWRPELWKGRVLLMEGKDEVKKDPNRSGLEEQINSHREAGQLLMSPRVRPSRRKLDDLGSEEKKVIYLRAKDMAAYWLGLLSYEGGRWESAKHWFGERILESERESRWQEGARYNLGRCYESLGLLEEAAEIFRQSTSSAQRHGNLVRARSLLSQAEEENSESQE